MRNAVGLGFSASMLGLSMLWGAALPAAAGPAVNQFEIKDLDIEQGEVEIEDQADFSFGQPRRKFIDGGGDDVEFDDNEVSRQRHSLELSFGLTSRFKSTVGVELEEERFDEPDDFAQARAFGDLKATEIQFEGVAVLIPIENNGVGIGAYYEFQVPRGDEAKTLFLGSIVQAVDGPWSATGNFAFVKFIGGEARDEKWDFAYFTQVKYEMSDRLALALEAFGTIDRLGHSGRPSEVSALIGDQDQHRVGPVVYYTFKPERRPTSKADDGDGGSVTVGVGYLLGLNENTPDSTLKLAVEVEY